MKDVFLDASDPQKCFNITILEDTVVDPNETFRVEVDISSFTEVATETRPATVTILDNDGECVCACACVCVCVRERERERI